MVRLKIRNGENDIRRISVPKEVEYAHFVGQLRKLLSVPKNEDIVVKYLDDEGDQITISTDIELHEALSNCVKEPLQFIIFRKAATGEQALFEEFESNILLSSLQSSVRNSVIVKDDDKLQEEAKRVEEEMKKAEELMELLKLRQQEENRRLEEARILEEKRRVEEENRKLEEEARIKIELEEKRKEEERKKNENKNTSKPYCWGEFKARNGRRVLLDLSSEALTKFKVKPFERVEAPTGYGTVVGTDQELGFLWVQLDKDMNSGVSYWDDVKDYDSMICKGIIPLEIAATADQVPKVLLPISNPFDRTYDDVKDPKERALLEKALQDSLLEIKRKEIEAFYGKK